MEFLHCLSLGLLVLVTIHLVTSVPEYVNPPYSEHCRFTEMGVYYNGPLSRSISNRSCIPWDDPDLAEFGEEMFGENHTSLTKEWRNYCKALPGDRDTPREPWCFTSEGKEACDVPLCSSILFRSTRQCLLKSGDGIASAKAGFMSYNGDYTMPSGQCLKWTDDVVQSVGFELWQFSGAHSWEEMDNFCRNPDNDKTIWCYSRETYANKGKLSKLYCQGVVPNCSTLCRESEGSLEYVGGRDRSETRKPCIPAQAMIPEIFTTEAERRKWFENRYVNDDYDIPLTQCRSNPNQIGDGGINEDGPVCYVNHTNTGEVREEGCAIYFCGPVGANFTGELFNFAFLTTAQPGGEDRVEYRDDGVTSSEVGEAWRVLGNWPEDAIPYEAMDSPHGTTIGILVMCFTGLLLLLLTVLDCASIASQITSTCKRNTKGMSDAMKDLYGSRISLGKNQVSPNDSESDINSSTGRNSSSGTNMPWAQKPNTQPV